MDGLQVSLLGGLGLQYRGAGLAPIPSTAARSLLAYLVLNRDRAHSRDQLAGIFWPDVPEPRARRRLSQALWLINTVLSETPESAPYILTTPSHVRFNPRAPVWVDVEEFQAAVASAEVGGDHERAAAVADLDNAVELYRGDLLDGFYDDWHLVDRERLRGEYLGALGKLIRLHKGNGDYQSALGCARRLVAHDPLREPAHRDVMRLLYLLGRSSEALQQFDQCVAILDTELGVMPEPETLQLQAEIASRRRKGEEPHLPAVDAPLYSQDLDIPLVGRDDERATVIRRFEEALAGRGGVVLVEGHSGVGKTRLLRQLADDANWRGLGVLWSQAGELHAHQPFEPLAQALREGLTPLRAEQVAELVEGPWLGAVSALFKDLQRWIPDLPRAVPLEAAEEPARIREAVARILAAMGRIHPHVLFLDDVQWADDDALAALTSLAPQLTDEALLICIAYRGDEARLRPATWGALQRLDQAPGSRRVILEPLNTQETHELIEQALGRTGVAGEFTEGLYYETGGNPLFVLETLRSMYDQPLDPDDREWPDLDPSAPGSALPLSAGISEAINRRVAALSPEPRSLLEAAAVLVDVPDTEVLQHTAGLDRQQVLQRLEALLRGGFLTQGDGSYGFRHHQIRRVVYEAMDSDRRRSLHGTAGRALQRARPEAAADLAHHFTLAEQWDRAVVYHGLAGDGAAALHSYRTAAEHFAKALQHADAAGLSARDRWDLLGSQEEVLDVLGQRDEQSVVVEGLSELAWDSSTSAEAERRRGMLHAHSGRFKQAEAAASLAVELAPPGGIRARALMTLGQALAWGGDRAGAVQYLESAAQEFDEGSRERADAHRTLGNVLSDLQRHQEALAHLEAALDIYEARGEKRGRAEAMGIMATVYMELGEIELAEQMHREALESCRAIAYRHGEALNYMNLAILLTLDGRPGQALEASSIASEIFGVLGNRRLEAQVRANAAAIRHINIGDDDRALADADAALAFYRQAGHASGQAHCLDVLGGIANRRGQSANARAMLSEALGLLADEELPWLEVQLRRTSALFHLQDGNIERAHTELDIASGLCSDLGLTGLQATIDGVRGLAELEAGDYDSAMETLADADGRIERGVDQPYLIPFWLYRAAAAAGRNDLALKAIGRAHDRLNAMLDDVAPEMRDVALSVVPEHGEIISAFQALTPITMTVALPARVAPTGRPLREDEFLEVTWTLTHPDDDATKDPIERRRNRIIRLVDEAARQGALPTVADLTEALGASNSTIRRDLAAIRSRGVLVATRGSR